jgi:hypothetical protein
MTRTSYILFSVQVLDECRRGEVRQLAVWMYDLAELLISLKLYNSSTRYASAYVRTVELPSLVAQ